MVKKKLTPFERVEKLERNQNEQMNEVSDQYKLAEGLLARIPITKKAQEGLLLWDHLSQRICLAESGKPMMETKFAVRAECFKHLAALVDRVIDEAEKIAK